MNLRTLAAVASTLCLCPVLFTRGEEDVPGSFYVAAVYEHRVVLNPEPHVPLSRVAALEHMWENLDVYEEQTARAAEQGAQIMVFPEDGLQGFNFSRSSIAGYLETIPDPQRETWNPCTQPDRHTHTEVLQRLSCMARRHSLYLVANMPDLQPCLLTPDPSCPPDGHWQFNTDVVFRSDGALVGRYHKHNLYFEKAFDRPPRPEVTTFDTPFAGKFGVFTCFDILFHDPAVILLKQGVRQLVYPTAWMNQLPLLAAVQFQRAFSLGAGVSVLGANIRSDLLGMTGSGLFSPTTALYHHARAGAPEEGRLLVGRVPILDPAWLGERKAGAGTGMESTRPGEREGKETPFTEVGGPGMRGAGAGAGMEPTRPGEREGGKTPSTDAGGHGEGGVVELGEVRGEGTSVGAQAGSTKPLDSGFCLQESQHCQGNSLSPSSFTSSMMYDPFSFLLLRGSEGELNVCNGPLCCHLQFRRSTQGGDTELYALGAFAGTHTVNGRYAVQVCALVRCSGSETSSCGQEVEETESRVDFLLEGKFRTRHVYPSVLVSGLVLEQPDQVKRTAGGRVAMRHSGKTAGLVTACLYGRVYDQD